MIDAKGNITYSGYCPIENGTLAIGGRASRADEAVPTLTEVTNHEAFSYFRAKDAAFWGNIVSDYAAKIESHKDEGKELLNNSFEIWDGSRYLQFDKEFAIIDPEDMKIIITVKPKSPNDNHEKRTSLKAAIGYGEEGYKLA